MDNAKTALEQAIEDASITRSVIVDAGALARLPEVLGTLASARAWQLVADANTMDAAGHRVLAQLRASGIAIEAPIVLDEVPRVKPRVETARDVGARLGAAGTWPIAVGAGVINDVTKYAAQVAGVPYVSVVTAASMDGYAASGAALLDNGFKRTLACAPPIAIVADLDVAAAAPARMAAWGYGDLAGKVIAGADWILADAVGEDPIAAEPFALVHDHLPRWLSGVHGIAAQNLEALGGLVEGLLISGFAMQAHGSSRPASGSEHQLAHVWEMDRISVDGEPVAHGSCVGVATIAMLALYEWFLSRDIRSVATDLRRLATMDPRAVEAELEAAFADAALVQSATAEMAAKLARAERRPQRVAAISAAWPTLRRRLESALVPAITMQKWLATCGAASHPSDLHVSLVKLAADYRRARLIRRRYTILDCLDDLGLLDEAIQALFASGGFWRSHARSSHAGAAVDV